MKLTDSWYNQIKTMYSAIQVNNLEEANLRRNKVYSENPILADYDEKLGKLRLKFFDASMDGEDTKNLQEEIDAYVKKKEDILTSLYPPNYLDPIYTCSKCHDTGIDGNDYCECFKHKAITFLYNSYNNTNVNKKHTFDIFNPNLYSDELLPNDMTMLSPRAKALSALKTCKEYANHIGDPNYPQNLYIYGGVGAGKTFLTECIFNQVLTSYHSAIYLTAIELFKLCKKTRFIRFDEDAESIKHDEWLLETELLVIDDLGTEVITDTTISDLFYYINARMGAGKSTLITSNLTPGEIANIYDTRISSRISTFDTIILDNKNVKGQDDLRTLL